MSLYLTTKNKMNYTAPISAVIHPEKVNQIMEAINRAEKIVITTHRSPDGDALGSSLALYHFLKRKNKTVKVIVPNSFPYFLKWMPGAREVEVYEYNPSFRWTIIYPKEWETWLLTWNNPRQRKY